MSSTTKLLPCPFCSNADISIKNENPKDNSGGYFIECPGCGASTALRFACGDDPTHLLAEQWNRRTASNRLHQIQEPEADIWPCVNIDVDDSGKITNAKLYSPGLPAGNHDVYPVRVPYMDEHTEAWLACAAELRKHLPDFMHLRDMNGIECAVAAIRELAERSAPALAAPAAVAVPDERKDLAPGVMRCAKCEFQLVRQVLAVNLGQVFAGHSKTESCPNGCGPLWPVTWKQYAEQAIDAAENMADRAFAAEKEVAQLRAALAPTAAAAPAAVAGSAPCTFMTADQARDWAWNKVREDVGTEGWTAGDSANYYGFFLWGWNFRSQYELQRTATRTAVIQEILSAAPAAVAVPDGWKLVPIQVPSSAFLWVSGGYSADYKASDPRDQKVIDERAQSTWENILDSISPPALAATPAAGELATLQAGLQAAAPVVLPEPDFWVRPGATIHPDRGWQCWSNDGTATGAFHADTVRALLAGVSAPAAQVIVDFEQIGSAGPFPVVSGRVKLPEVTMVDLARMLKPTTDAQAQADALDAEQYRLLQRGQDTIQADDEFLREDGVTWRKDPSGIFVGAIYEGNILLPARRAIAAQAAKG